MTSLGAVVSLAGCGIDRREAFVIEKNAQPQAAAASEIADLKVRSPMHQLPFIEAGSGGALALYKALPHETAALVRTALGAHPLLAVAAPTADALSRRWLDRQENPYRQEIHEVARRLGRPGAYLLNIVYEWACSTATGPDPDGEGARMVRVLDWGMPGIGRYLALARHETAAGPYVAATWPGYAGVLTAMAPGRFSAAINQAPKQPLVGLPIVDDVGLRLQMLRSKRAIPATHLLRQVFETAADYHAAVAMLSDTGVRLAMPAIFIVSGTRAEHGCIIEARDSRRRVHVAANAEGWVTGVANAWLGDWPGTPRLHAHVKQPGETPESNNRERRRLVGEMQRGAALEAPVLNRHTVMVARMSAARGEIEAEAYDLPPGAAVPALVGRGRYTSEA
jgi:hypothetical protein